MAAEAKISNNINCEFGMNWVIDITTTADVAQQIIGTIKLTRYLFILRDNN